MHRLAWVDYAMIVGYFVAIVGIAAWFSRRQTSTERYFVGSRSVPWWAMGISLMATLISSITFVGYPGDAYADNWSSLVPGLMVPVVLLLMASVVIPFYRQAVGMSAYEYFEKRFGYGARVYTSMSFLLMQISKMATVLYALSLALSTMAGWNIYTTLVALEVITIVYVLIGGIEAVIWTSVLQGVVLTAGGLSCLWVLLFRPAGGPTEVINLAWTHGKFSLGRLSTDLTEPTFLVLALFGITVYIQKYSTDQAIVQRYLVAKSNREAVRGTMMGALLCIPVWALFLLIGSCVWSYYRIMEIPLDAALKADKVFPMFIVTELPTGIVGLVLAALIATAIDADLNSLSVVVVEDYYRKFFPAASDRQRLTVGKVTVAVTGILTIGGAVLLAGSADTAVKTAFQVASVVSGGVTGLFALAFLAPRATKQGAYVGIAGSIAFTAWATMTRMAPDKYRWGFTHDSRLIGVYSTLLLFTVGYVASRFLGPSPTPPELTLVGWLRKRREQRLVGGLDDRDRESSQHDQKP